jgi:hypothetical protein
LRKLLDAPLGKATVLAEGGTADCDICGPEGLFDTSPIDKEST